MTIHKLLRTYRFLDKDPVCDELRTLVSDEGLGDRLKIVAELSNLAPTTIHNLFRGHTRKPQNATVMAIATALGYQRTWTKDRALHADEELILARAWNKRERARQLAAIAAEPKHKTRKRARK